MTDFGKFCVLLVVLAIGLIIGGTIPHMPDNPPPKVTSHLFAPRDDIITWADRYEYIGEYRLTGYFPQEGELLNCVGKNLVPGDVAISQDIPLQYGDRVIIEKVGVGIIDGEHIVKDKTAHWITGTVDVYCRNPYIAQAITGTCIIHRRVK